MLIGGTACVTKFVKNDNHSIEDVCEWLVRYDVLDLSGAGVHSFRMGWTLQNY